MADPRYTRERSQWVLDRANRRPGANRRGQRLATRARRLARYDVGAGDAGTASVTTRSRFARLAVERDEHRGRWTMAAGLVEAARLIVAGPGVGLSWAIYGSWYRHVPTWGPLRWRTLAGIAGAVLAISLLIATGAVLFGTGLHWWGWWLLAQPVIGTARAAWLAYAYGWEAAPAAAATGAPAPVRVRLGDAPALPTTTPTEPVKVPVKAVRVRVPAPASKED